MTLAPGSLLWLVRHDLVLMWRRARSFFGNRSPVKIALIMVSIFAGLHLLAAPLGFSIMRDVGVGGIALAVANGVMFVIPWQISQGISQSARLLYSSGDLDLLLSSPTSARRIAASHSLAMTIESTISIGIFLTPIANILAWQAGVGWLAIYVVIFTSALLATAIGLAMTIGLFAIFGPRRTHFVAQIVSTITASIFILGLQLLQIIPERHRIKIMSVIRVPGWGEFLDDRDSWMWLPVRAASGNWQDLLLWSLVCIAGYLLVAVALGPMFLRSAVLSAGHATSLGSANQSRRDAAFRVGVASAIRRKELQLLGRDHAAMSQLFLQMAYTAPISFIIWAGGPDDQPMAVAIAPTVVMIACHLSAALSWLALSSEDAPDLMASAPVPRQQLERHKLEAIAMPLAIVLLVPIIWLGLYEPKNALLTAVFACAAAASTAMLNVWNPLPGRREDLMRRHAPSKLVALFEHLFALCWAVAVTSSVLGQRGAFIPVIPALLLLWLARRRARKRLVAP